jgi:hypothetical protein
MNRMFLQFKKPGRLLLSLTLRFTWVMLGLWTAMALFFTAPWPQWVSALAAAGVAALYVRALKRPYYVRRYSFLGAVASFALVLTWYFGFVDPDPNRDWAPYHSVKANIEINGDKIRVRNVRNFTWRSPTDFTKGFYEREYDLSLINSMYYIVVPLNGMDFVAHVFVSFGFSDGKALAISVEGRREVNLPYQIIPSMFRQFQLIYAVGDERDMIGLRGAVWKHPVRFYPAKASPEIIRAIFVDMLERAQSLEEKPEFYNLFFNNCMNNISHHLRRLSGRSVPSDLSLLLTGLSDQVAYSYGFIDTDLPFPVAREVFRVDDWMRTTPLDDKFSERLRAHLKEAITEANSR